MKHSNDSDFKWILKKSSAEAHISSDRVLCDRTGINYRTLRDRFSNPGTLRLFELWALLDVLNISDEDLLILLRKKSKN